MNPIQNNIIDELGLNTLSTEEKEETLVNIGGLIYQNVLMRSLENMPDANQDEFEKLLDNNAKAEDIFNFLNNKVVNFQEIVSEEINKFKNKTNTIMDQIG